VIHALDAITLRAHTVATLGTIILAALEVGTAVNAGLLALWSALGASAIAVVGRGRVVCARLKLVGIATRLITIVATIDHTCGLPVLVHSWRDTTVAAHISVKDAAARSDVLGGEVGGVGSLAVNADAISHGLSGSMCPAAAAFGLVADLLQTGALGSDVLLTPVKIRWEVLHPNFWFPEGKELGWVGLLLGTHEGLGLTEGHTFETLVGASDPGALVADKLEVQRRSSEDLGIHHLSVRFPVLHLSGNCQHIQHCDFGHHDFCARNYVIDM